MSTKSILTIIICVALGLGYYAWRQQQNALSELEGLKKSGVAVTFFLRTRPLVAVDKQSQKLYLLSGKGAHTIRSISFEKIDSIVFTETPFHNEDHSLDPKPDTIIITLTDGKRIRIGDLQKTAQHAKDIFDTHNILTDVSSVVLRR